jgi:hypothetical protein
MCFNVALSSTSPYGDSRRIFAQGSQQQLLNLMVECLDHCAPTPHRIKEGILAWPTAIQKNSEANGAAVADLDFRSGCRILRIDGKEAPDGSLLRKKKP